MKRIEMNNHTAKKLEIRELPKIIFSLLIVFILLIFALYLAFFSTYFFNHNLDFYLSFYLKKQLAVTSLYSPIGNSFLAAADESFFIPQNSLNWNPKVEKVVNNLTTEGRKKDITSEETIRGLEARIKIIENLIRFISEISKSSLRQINIVFITVSSFFGLFSAFSAYRQILADRRRESLDEEMRGLVGSFRDNINVINTLISTLERSYSYRKEVESQIEEINNLVSGISSREKETQKSYEDKVASLNSKAFTVFRTYIDRQKFKLEENKRRLESFYLDMKALEIYGVKTFFNPLCYFLKALHLFNNIQYELARDALEEARNIGFKESVQPEIAQYGGECTEKEIEKELARMVDDCYYHLGIIYYNLGDYNKARDRFKESYQRNHLDFRARYYIPELMFFDSRISFKKVIAQFSAAEKDLKSVSLQEQQTAYWSKAMASLKMREGNCYLPKIIPLSSRNSYRTEENSEKAARIYWDAYDYAKKIQGERTLTEIFVNFSLAQALENIGSSNWRGKNPNELFQQVFLDIRQQISFQTEPIVLVLLNYTLSICVKRANLSGENYGFYLAEARKQLKDIPSEVLIFSPINKINLTREEIISEIDFFEKV